MSRILTIAGTEFRIARRNRWVTVSALMMMIFGGIGIDMMYAELQRTKIQNTLDRAVLAAADLDNELDAQGVVEDYMARMGLSDALVSVDVDEGLNYRTVTADGYRTMPSNFMQLIGIDNMQAGGHAQAMERINKVEVSMVLDISGSMDDGDKMAELQTAASDFVDTLLASGGGEDLLSLWSGTEVAGQRGAQGLATLQDGGIRDGEYRRCIDNHKVIFLTDLFDHLGKAALHQQLRRIGGGDAAGHVIQSRQSTISDSML